MESYYLPDPSTFLTRVIPTAYTRPREMWVDVNNHLLRYPNGVYDGWDCDNITLDEILTMSIPTSIHQPGQIFDTTLFLVAGNKKKNQPTREWFKTKLWNCLEFADDRMLWATYRNGNAYVHLKGTGIYFDELHDFQLLIKAYSSLRATLRDMLNNDMFQLAPTPAGTGRMILQALLPKDQEYPRLKDDPARYIIESIGQGRIETFPMPQVPVIGFPDLISDYTISKMDKIDGRLMYGACISHLPIGPLVMDRVDKFDGSKNAKGQLVPLSPGFYLAKARVPERWGHIGLLKAESGGYPRIPTGEWFDTFSVAEEIGVAIENGWEVYIYERWLWPETHLVTDPLANWRRRLISLYENCQDEYLRVAIRRIILHTLGSFAQFETLKEQTISRDKFISEISPTHKIDKIIRSTAKEITWLERIPLPKERQKWVHPEMVRVLWGRGRARVARMALKIPFEKIIGISTDEILCNSLDLKTLDVIASEDNGKPGDFRLKEIVMGPIPWPKNADEMRHILERQNIAKGK